VISRAVFGGVPTLRDTLAAQRRWGWRAIVPWLLWRRLHPGRALLIPVDLLEQPTGAQRGARVRVLSRANASPNVMLTLIGVNLEAMLGISIVLLGLMFVPVEFMSNSAKAVWEVLFQNPPLWAAVLVNFIGWIAITIVEPFYIGAGFGLYLNRRMQLEAWDIEFAFRRIAQRLAPPGLAFAASLLLAVMCMISAPLRAQQGSADQTQSGELQPDKPPPDKAQPDKSAPSAPAHRSARSRTKPAVGSAHDDSEEEKNAEIDTTLEKMFADSYRDDGASFGKSVKQAYAQGDLNPKVKESFWRRRVALNEEAAAESPAWARAIGQVLGFFAEFWLWIMLAIALVLIVVNHQRWLPWISDRIPRARTRDPIGVHTLDVAAQLPADIPGAVRMLWKRGNAREALALLYRAAVERLSDSLGVPFAPGATESDCLRYARRLGDQRYASLFEQIVRCWQAAAYARRLPLAADVEVLLEQWTLPPETPA
jgi:hypothetical protein